MKTIEYKQISQKCEIISLDYLDDINELLDSQQKYYLIVDSFIDRNYSNFIKSIPNTIGKFVINAEEKNKSFDTYNLIIDDLLKLNVSKNTTIINIGGGITTDLGGFVSSTYKRGLTFINIPTTLIGLIDASIGGKNGINIGNYKNMVGTINEPSKIIQCREFLNTLNDDEIVSGKIEMLKLALVYDINLLKYLELSSKNIYKFALKKAEICLIDEKCQNIRNILNFGHTIGHALEIKNGLKHGFSVGLGMYLITKNQDIKEFIKSCLLNIGFDINNYLHLLDKQSIKEYIEIIKNDKKNDDMIRIIDLEEINKPVIKEISILDMEERLQYE